MPEVQKQEDGAHVRHLVELGRLEKHIDHFSEVGDHIEADKFRALHKHTTDRHAHALRAKVLIDRLELSHEVTPDTITYNDALNYVAKTLHEMQHAEAGSVEAAKSQFARAHQHLAQVKGTRHDGKGNVLAPDEHHVDQELLAAPRDHVAEVIDHLGLTKPEHLEAVKGFFGKAA